MLSPLDFVLLHLGNPGRYSLFIAFLIYCLALPISFTNNLWKYYAEEPPHRCYLPPEYINGTTADEWIPVLPQSGSVKRYSSCTMYLDPHNHWKGSQKCINGWEYRPPDGEFNIITEFDLVCERRDILLNAIFYSHNIAAILGGIVFGYLSDRLERKRSLLLSLYLFIASAFALHFVQDLVSFAICFALQSFFITGVLVCSFVLLMELFATPYQLQGSLFFIAFAVAFEMTLPLLVWLIKSWRYVQLAVSAPGVVFLAHVWLLPQSPLWLTLEGRMLTVENLIEKLARSNGKVTFPPSFRLHLRNLFNQVKSCSVSYATRHQLANKFSSPCLRWFFLVHFYLFFVLGLSLDVTDSHVMRLNENKYADHFYRGLIDLGSVMLVYYFATRLGPRSTQSALFVFAGLLMMGSITLHETLPREPPSVTTGDKNATANNTGEFDYRLFLVPSTLVSAAKALLKTIPALIWYHAAKTLPTGIRTVGFACCYAWTIVGQMAAVNLLILADLIAPLIPLGLCGSLSVVAGGLSLLFPSCWRRPLPNTVEEAENKALIPIKDRYPSFRDLNRTGLKLVSLASGNSIVQSNLYSSHPSACAVKELDNMTTHHRPLHRSHSSSDESHHSGHLAHHDHQHHHHDHYEVAQGFEDHHHHPLQPQQQQQQEQAQQHQHQHHSTATLDQRWNDSELLSQQQQSRNQYTGISYNSGQVNSVMPPDNPIDNTNIVNEWHLLNVNDEIPLPPLDEWRSAHDFVAFTPDAPDVHKNDRVNHISSSPDPSFPHQSHSQYQHSKSQVNRSKQQPKQIIHHHHQQVPFSYISNASALSHTNL